MTPMSTRTQLIGWEPLQCVHCGINSGRLPIIRLFDVASHLPKTQATCESAVGDSDPPPSRAHLVVEPRD